MSKFKIGEWLRESDSVPGDSMRHHGYYVYALLPNGDYVVETNPDDYLVVNDNYFIDCVVEPRCTGWDWVLPEPANRFRLEVGDVVTIVGHSLRKGEDIIESIEDSYADGIARFRLRGARGSWHPYWFGLCDEDGSPLPPKPETYKMYEYVGMRYIPGDGGYVELLHLPDLTKSPSSGRPIVATGRVFEIPKGENP